MNDPFQRGERPPGAHLNFPEIAWPASVAEPLLPEADAPTPAEKLPPASCRCGVWWALIIVCFAALLARAEGFL